MKSTQNAFLSLENIKVSLNNPPDGSHITPYMNPVTGTNNHFKVFLSKNLGYSRSDSETAIITFPIDFKSMSFELSSDSQLNSLKTPIKIIDIINTDTTESLFSISLHNKIYWYETPQAYHKIPLFLEQQAQKFTINNHGTYLNFIIDKQFCKIPLQASLNTVKIGIIRSDLLRYKGQIVPEQSLNITNIVIKK